MNVDIGRLKQRISFCILEEKEDKLGQSKQFVKEVKKVWANIIPISGKEFYEAKKLAADASYKIYVRYLSDIEPDMFIKYKEKIFDITSVVDMGMEHKMLELRCTERKKKVNKYGTNNNSIRGG